MKCMTTKRLYNKKISHTPPFCSCWIRNPEWKKTRIHPRSGINILVPQHSRALVIVRTSVWFPAILKMPTEFLPFMRVISTLLVVQFVEIYLGVAIVCDWPRVVWVLDRYRAVPYFASTLQEHPVWMLCTPFLSRHLNTSKSTLKGGLPIANFAISKIY